MKRTVAVRCQAPGDLSSNSAAIRDISWLAPGLPITIDMSGEAVAHALKVRFEEIRRVEWERLRKKTAGLSPEQQAEVEAITERVVHAIWSAPATVLRESGGSGPLVQAIVRLFGVSQERADLSARWGRA